MKYLLNRERLRRQTFKDTEPKYIALKSIVHNQTLPNSLRWEASLLLSKIIKKNSRSSFKNRCFLTGRGGSYSRFFNLSTNLSILAFGLVLLFPTSFSSYFDKLA